MSPADIERLCRWAGLEMIWQHDGRPFDTEIEALQDRAEAMGYGEAKEIQRCPPPIDTDPAWTEKLIQAVLETGRGVVSVETTCYASGVEVRVYLSRYLASTASTHGNMARAYGGRPSATVCDALNKIRTAMEAEDG